MSEISILGLSGSLRDARFRLDSRSLAKELELIGRYLQSSKEETEYRSVGYESSATKAREEQAAGKTSSTISGRLADHSAVAQGRIAIKRTGST
jgi:hypothetical protein